MTTISGPWGARPGGGQSRSLRLSGLSASLDCRHYEGNTTKLAALCEPMVAWCNDTAQHQLGIRCSAHASYTWNQSEYRAQSKIWDNASFIPKEWVCNEPWISYLHSDARLHGRHGQRRDC